MDISNQHICQDDSPEQHCEYRTISKARDEKCSREAIVHGASYAAMAGRVQLEVTIFFSSLGK
jgi:hypothetical protein